MDAVEDRDPAQPDLVLLCKGGAKVPALSCLLLLASAPLRPAIRLALQGATVPAVLDDEAEQAAKRVKHEATEPILKVEDDDAFTWALALQYLDPMRLSRPVVAWDVVEPLLVLSHKYDLKIPKTLCEQFLLGAITKANYAKLPTAQLARLRSWLSLTSRLNLITLHNQILDCIRHCTLITVRAALLDKATKEKEKEQPPASQAKTPGTDVSGYGAFCARRSSASASPFGSFGATTTSANPFTQQSSSAAAVLPLPAPKPAKPAAEISTAFKIIWSGSPGPNCSAAQVRSALLGLEQKQLIGLLEALMAPAFNE